MLLDGAVRPPDAVPRSERTLARGAYHRGRRRPSPASRGRRSARGRASL